MPDTQTLLDVPLTRREIQGFYAKAAPVYDEHSAKHKDLPKAKALDTIARTPGEAYLEVAVGTGAGILKQVTSSGSSGVFGVDLPPAMVDTARSRQARRRRHTSSVSLLLADARHLPWTDASFDCLLNSYMST